MTSRAILLCVWLAGSLDLASCAHPTSSPPGAAAIDAAPAPEPPHVPPEVAGGIIRPGTPGLCDLVGCESGVDVVAHVDAPPADLARAGHFRACLDGTCWDGTFNAPPAGRQMAVPCRFEHRRDDPFRCFMGPGGMGSRVRLNLVPGDGDDAGAHVDGDTLDVTVTVTVAGRTLLHETRAVRWDNLQPNGAECGPVCRHASVDLGAPDPSDAGSRGSP